MITSPWSPEIASFLQELLLFGSSACMQVHAVPRDGIGIIEREGERITIHLPWIECKTLDSPNCQQELILRHAAELDKAEADGGFIVIKLNDTAGTQATSSASQRQARTALDACMVDYTGTGV